MYKDSLLLFIYINSNKLWIFDKIIRCFNWTIHVHCLLFVEHHLTRSKILWDRTDHFYRKSEAVISVTCFFRRFYKLHKIESFCREKWSGNLGRRRKTANRSTMNKYKSVFRTWSQFVLPEFFEFFAGISRNLPRICIIKIYNQYFWNNVLKFEKASQNCIKPLLRKHE